MTDHTGIEIKFIIRKDGKAYAVRVFNDVHSKDLERQCKKVIANARRMFPKGRKVKA